MNTLASEARESSYLVYWVLSLRADATSAGE
jgi:hypothetical protein